MDLNDEYTRFRTFDNYPVYFLSPWTLAFLGFYFIGPNDDVECQFCKVVINSWEFGDEVFTEHKRWSPNCPLLLRQPTRNIPRSPLLFAKLMDRVAPRPPSPPPLLPPRRPISLHIPSPYVTRDIPPPSASASAAHHVCQTMTSVYKAPELPLLYDLPYAFNNVNEIKYPTYASEYQRVATYEKWSNKYDPIALAESGFFYTGKADRVTCFNCGVGLHGWDINDDPWEQHALASSKCSFLIKKKGSEYIKRVILASRERKNITTHLVDVSCKVCHVRNYNAIFLPCRHVSTCLECTKNLQACPICNESFERYLTLYLC